MRLTTVDIAPVAAAVLVSLLVLAVPATAHAEWDLEQIGQVKAAAEAAYEAGDYVAASRHYIELRRLLKDALEAGEVPEEMVAPVNAALVAAGYQLGRTNQQSGNCEGALTVYDELVVATDADLALRARARARLAETHLCLGRAALDRAELPPAIEQLRQADAAIETLDALLAGELTEPPTEVPELLAAARTDTRALEADITTSLVAEISRATDRTQCEDLATWLALADAELPAALPSGGVEGNLERCEQARLAAAAPEPAPQPVPTETVSSDVPWWPGLIIVGVGGATLIGGAVADGLLAGDIDDFDDLREQCLRNDIGACHEARRLKGDIESQQTVVVALYVTGGIVTAAGVVYTAVTASMAAASGDDAPSTTPQVGLVPTRDGVMSSFSVRF